MSSTSQRWQSESQGRACAFSRPEAGAIEHGRGGRVPRVLTSPPGGVWSWEPSNHPEKEHLGACMSLRWANSTPCPGHRYELP